jgi:hypothetical protein
VTVPTRRYRVTELHRTIRHTRQQVQQRELDLQVTLGPTFIATSYAAPEVGETIARARTLAEQLDRILVRVLYGQWVFRFVQGEDRLALSHAREIEAPRLQRRPQRLLFGFGHRRLRRGSKANLTTLRVRLRREKS